MQWARGRASSATTQLVLFGLADRSDPHGITYVGQATIAEDCSCGVRTVRENLARLEREGVIARFRRTNSKGWRTSDYIVLGPHHEDRGPMEDVTDDELDVNRYPAEVAWTAMEGVPEIVTIVLPADDAARSNRHEPPLGEVLPADDAAPTGSSRPPNRQITPSLAAAPAGEQLEEVHLEKSGEHTDAGRAAPVLAPITEEEAETARRFRVWRDDHPEITKPLDAWRRFTAEAEAA